MWRDITVRDAHACSQAAESADAPSTDGVCLCKRVWYITAAHMCDPYLCICRSTGSLVLSSPPCYPALRLDWSPLKDRRLRTVRDVGIPCSLNDTPHYSAPWAFAGVLCFVTLVAEEGVVDAQNYLCVFVFVCACVCMQVLRCVLRSEVCGRPLSPSCQEDRDLCWPSHSSWHCASE